MEELELSLEKLIGATGLDGDSIAIVRYVIMVVLSFAFAWFVGWVCRSFIVPVVMKITRKTDIKWDDVILGEKVLISACHIIPAIVIWGLLPLVFNEHPRIADIVGRLTAIYITIMTVRTVIVFIDSFKQLEDGKRTARQQYLYSICGVLKIVMIFIAAIVVMSIAINKDPSTLFAGLGAASAILMLAFQDTIKGLVAGIRLTSNDMLHIGDWITVPSAGANGRVEEIALTMVKVRNFDNTIITLSPQSLVDGSFQNWIGMEEGEGRKQVRKIFLDFDSLKIDDDGIANMTRFRKEIEKWLCENPKVVGEMNPLVRQTDTMQAGGCCVELIFWLKAKDVISYEHDTSDIMDYVYAKANEYGLKIYQPGVPSN